MSTEQLQIDAFLDPEKQFFQEIRQSLVDVINLNRVPPEYLSFDKRNAYYAITYRGSVVARFKFNRAKASAYIEFPAKVLGAAEASSITAKVKDGMAKFEVSDIICAAQNFGPLCCKTLDYVINQYPKGFDCCSRFEACSDAKGCIHPDRHLAADCGYRRILKDGRIFFGKNRNI